LGISQEELGGRAGLHRTYICDIERGARNVSLESIEKIAAALEISLSKLFAYDPSGSPKANTESSTAIIDILFAEDNPRDVEMTLGALKGITNHVHVVGDGREALDFLFCEGSYTDRRPCNRPQLILLDIGLPKIHGLEVLRRIKADTRTASIPVVVLTASGHDQDVQLSKRLGAENYIIKPFGMSSLTRLAPTLNFSWALVKR
jgi:CheY-like chemotaxis protein/DNA-binding Xre family transcriptional regulator